MREVQRNFKGISLGAASITCSLALKSVAQLGLSYAMSPFWNPILQKEAIDLNQLLVPGVFSPKEVQEAIRLGCKLIKLFPASKLGKDYLHQLKSMMNPLPFVIAAGGLEVSDLDSWIQEGYGAIVLGRGIIKNGRIDLTLQNWLQSKKDQSQT